MKPLPKNRNQSDTNSIFTKSDEIRKNNKKFKNHDLELELEQIMTGLDRNDIAQEGQVILNQDEDDENLPGLGVPQINLEQIQLMNESCSDSDDEII